MTETDYLRQLQALLPPGPAWQRDGESPTARIFSALAAEFAAVDSRAVRLVDEADPRVVVELIGDWERVAGLPDPIIGPAETLQGRRGHLAARLVGIGGQSKEYYVAVAAGFGFMVAISEFRQFRVGQQRMGMPLCGDDWRWAWAVDAPAVSLTSFRMGASAMGERLQSWGNEVLERLLNKIRPAHTLVIFRYGSVLGNSAGPMVLDQGRLG